MPTLVCVPIMVEEIHSALADAGAAKSAGADLVEFRIDPFFTGSGETAEIRAIVRLVSESPLPCIVTCRTAAEGGQYEGDDQARANLLERLGTARGHREHPPRYVDLELASYTASPALRHALIDPAHASAAAPDLGTSLVLSIHDVNGRPPNLSRRILQIADEPAAAVVKIAYRARSLRDNLELFDLLAENAAGKPTIALAMGEFGLLSRVLAPKFGAYLTFATLRPQDATAPGQPSIRDLLDLYRFRSIGPRTRLYGVIGWPVGHSLSPVMHNAAFEAAGHDGVYLPLPVPPEFEHFKATTLALTDHQRLDFDGASVTTPHKRHLVRLAREESARPAGPGLATRWELDRLSDICGAANTLAVERGEEGSARRCRVLNTDGPAVAACLRGALGSIGGKRVAIIGAGGTAGSAAAALALEGAAVVVHNRTRANAQSLVDDLRARIGDGAALLHAADLGTLRGSSYDALINCTPVGMRHGPDRNASPIDAGDLRNSSPSAVVFDCVYDPLRTPLLEAASAAGLRTVDGLTLLVAQAAGQFEAWTGAAAPLGLLDRVAREAAQVRKE